MKKRKMTRPKCLIIFLFMLFNQLRNLRVALFLWQHEYQYLLELNSVCIIE